MIYQHDGWDVTVINGKNTGALGVEDVHGPANERVKVTSIERTLIDIVVRPEYSGGIFNVLDAYRAAKDRVSTNRLMSVLKKLDYIYPYHQSIGFLMERAGFDFKRYSRLKEPGIELNFYLSHGITDPMYSEEWKLYYPSGM